MILVFGTFFLIVFSGLLSYVGTQRHASVKKMQREEAFNIAEAGLENYRWYLNSALGGLTETQLEAYWDGDPIGVPYYDREYKDPQGNIIGKYRLEVTVPEDGSNIIEAQSTGWHYDNPEVTRTIKARFRKPSWSEYVVVANDVMRFGEGTETWGRIHSNDGIRFDGVANNLVSSAKTTYWDPDTATDHDGVWTSQVDPTQVFLGGTSYPVANLDFNGIVSDLAQIKSVAEEQNTYFPNTGFFDGYHFVLKANQTMDVYQVLLRGDPSYYIYIKLFYKNVNLSGKDVVFVNDDFSVEGIINDQDLTMACADLSHGSNQYNIYINDDILYTGYDGSELLGLIAQGDISVGLDSKNNLRIDAAMIAQNGRVGREYYTSWQSSKYYKRNEITVYGAIATNQRYGFSWVCGSNEEYCSGYEHRNIIYDPKLMYRSPPYFPTLNEFKLDMWEEIK